MYRHREILSNTVLIILAIFVCFVVFALVSAYGADVTVQFNNSTGCQVSIVKAIDAETNSVWVQEYVLSAQPIVEALVRAAQRSNDVKVVLDPKQAASRAAIKRLKSVGIPVLLDGQHCIAHNKVIILGGRKVICGSYNLSAAAESCNAENVVWIEEPVAVLQFKGNFLIHAKHSRPSVE